MQKKSTSKKAQSKAAPVILALVLIILATGVFLVQKYMPTRDWMSTAEYFGDLKENEIAVVLQDHLTEERAILEGGSLYLDYEMVRENINSRFFWDEGNSQMLFTTALETYEIPPNSTDYTIDGVENSYEKQIVLLNENGLYLSADFLQLFTNMEYTLEPETSHVLIRYEWGTQKTAVVTGKTAVRYQGGVKSPILTEADKGDTVYVLEEMENWSQVLTGDGYIGYVYNRRLTDVRETQITRDFEEPEYSSLTREEKVNLVWHQIDVADANQYLEEDIADMTGVNVISPTWFFVADNEGNINSLASQEYVETAHNAGLEVWALISNFSADVDTTTLLSSTQARRKMVDYLVNQALELGIEGINLDFEYIREETARYYVQFVRELSIGCRKNHLVLSVDVPVPMDFNLYFDRKELGTVADYLIVMGYDEHYVGSEAGSVASLGFEENGIQGMLKEVPAEKIISGVPFYTRIWYSTEDTDGSMVVTSEMIGMDTVARTLETYGVTASWNEETQQNYAEWTVEDGTLCQIWIEDEQSLALKARLVDQYDLGGIAAWVLGFQRNTVWKVLTDNMGT